MKTEMKWFYGFCMAAFMCWVALTMIPLALAQETTTWGSDGPPAASVAQADKMDATVPALKPTKLRGDGPTWRERRAMGITWRNIKRILAEKQAAGEVDGRDSSVVAIEVFDQLVQDNPKVFMDAKAVPGRDWSLFFEALLAFIAKLIPLILMFI